MKLELVPKLAQQQTLSPKMLLSMKVLPLTNMELEHQLAQEVAENPALELVQEIPAGTGPEQKIDSISSALRLFQPYQDSAPRRGARNNDSDDFLSDQPARTPPRGCDAVPGGAPGVPREPSAPGGAAARRQNAARLFSLQTGHLPLGASRPPGRGLPMKRCQ